MMPLLPGQAPLSGREAEMAAILAACAAARAGAPRVILLTGEPGAGKSRLATEAAEHMRAQGALLARGYALAGSPGAPGSAIRRALAGLVPSRTDIPAASGIWTNLRESGVAGPVFDPEERARFCEAAYAAVAAATAHAPVVLVLDDMQWADSTAWEAVAYLARTIHRGLLMVLTMRDEGAWKDDSPGAEALAALNRQRALQVVPVRPLEPPALAELGAAIVGGALAPSVLAPLASATGGNPFLVEELLHGLLRAGRLRTEEDGLSADAADLTDVTGPLQLALAERLRALDPAARRFLDAAAIIGADFDLSLAAAVAGLDRPDARAAQGAAIESGIVIRHGDSASFRHDLLRAAILAAVPDQEELHRAAAVAIDGEIARRSAIPTDPVSSELFAARAEHWQQARDSAAPSASLDAARALSRQPERAISFARAARLAAGAAPRLRAEAARCEGDAALALGEFTAAEVAFRSAIDSYRSCGEIAAAGRAWIRLGALFHRREQPSEALGCLQEGVRLLDQEGAGGGADAVDAFATMSAIYGLTLAQYARAEECAQRALDLARTLRDPRLEARAQLAMAHALVRANRDGSALLEGAFQSALAAGDDGLAAEVAAVQANDQYWRGDLRESERAGRRRLERAEASGDLFGLRHAHSWLANVAASRGAWSEAMAWAGSARPVLARLESPEPVAFLEFVESLVAYRRGDVEMSYALARRATDTMATLGDGSLLWYTGLLIQACLATGRQSEAKAEIAAQEERLATIDPSALPARSARVLLGLAYATLGDRAAGLACEEALRPYPGDFHWGAASRTLAALALLRGDQETALADLATTEARARVTGQAPDLALALSARAGILGATSEGHAAREEARALLYELEMMRDLAALDQAPAPVPAGDDLLRRLTPREIEVLAMVARGGTNREIAQALGISERTVVNHVSNIFGKLGIENRAAAAAFAVRHGFD